MNEEKVKEEIPVRMHSMECDEAGIMSDTGEIPGGCIILAGKGELEKTPDNKCFYKHR